MEHICNFSIIIPIYNMEKYIDRCLESVLNQSYTEFEVWAINDGSTDKSREILKIYVERDKRIHLIDKDNGGIGSAVTEALKHVNNEYIIFLDSDDYLEINALEKIALSIKRNNEPDIVQFGLRMVDESGNIIKEERHGNYLIEGRNEILIDHFEKNATPSLACRSFKSDLFKEIIPVPSQNIGIDEILIVKLMYKAKRLISIDELLYNVFVRLGSVSRGVYSQERIKEFENVYRILFEFASNKVPFLKNYISIKYLKLLVGMICNLGLENSMFQEMKDKYDNCYKQVIHTSEYRRETISFRIGTGLFYHSPQIYILMKRGKKV